MRCLCIGIKGLFECPSIKGLFECPSINIMLRLCIIRVASCIGFVSTHAEQLRREQLLDCTQHSHRKMTAAGEGTQARRSCPAGGSFAYTAQGAALAHTTCSG
jgi:hypothetical protein